MGNDFFLIWNYYELPLYYPIFMKSLSILIFGATGMIGTELIKLLRSQQYEVKTMGRGPNSDYQWDPTQNQINKEALMGVDVIINLSGANVGAQRWTKSYKEKIYNSRVMGNELLYNTVKQNSYHPGLFITASATGIYPNKGIEPILEDSSLGNDFLAVTCKDWEKAGFQFEHLPCRTVAMRTGIVMGRQGGFIPRMSKFFKLYLGAVLGKGTQMVSWIHIDDLCNLILFAIQNQQISGAINATSPTAISQKELTYEMAKQLKTKIISPPIPPWFLRWVLGEFANELLSDKNVIPQKATEYGFTFQYPSFPEALKELLS